MKTLICYSGGYDSTAMLLQELWHNEGIIDTCYFTLPNNKAQQKLELKNRAKILKIIKKMPTPGAKGALRNDYTHDLYTVFTDPPPFELQQAYIWLQYLVMKVNLADYDRIAFGYVKYDDFWHRRVKWEKTLKANLKFSTYTKYPKIEFPCEWLTKTDLSVWFDTEKSFAKDIKPNIRKIKKLVTYCEEPTKKGKSCGKCSSCKRHDSELQNKEDEQRT